MQKPVQALIFTLAYAAFMYVRPHEFVPALIGVPILPVLLALAVFTWLAMPNKDFSAPQFRLLPILIFILGFSELINGLWELVVSAVTDFLPTYMLFLMLSTATDTVKKFKMVFTVLGASMSIIAVHCIYQAMPEAGGVGWSGAEMAGGRVTYVGFLNDPNDLSMALLMALPMTIYMARQSGRLMGLVWWAGSVAILDAVKLGNSRGAVLALGAMLFQYSLRRFGMMKSLIAAPLMLIPLIIFGPSRASEMSADEESAEGRVDAWVEGFDMILHYPLFGVGKGQFGYHHYLTAHNSYVLSLAEIGFIGDFVWISLMSIAVIMMWRMEFTRGELPPVPVNEPSGATKSNRIVKAVKDEAGTWDEMQDVSRALWYGLTGAMVSMFFLSRSYVIILYVQYGLIIAVFQMGQMKRPDLQAVTWKDNWKRMIWLTLGSAFALWIITLYLAHKK
jgi:putative inorganic carbon (HCO3(-)) transporter